MGYSASKGVRDHRLALAQHEARAKTWQNFQRDVDSIVRTHSRGPMAEASSPELQEQLAGRYSQYRRSQQKLDVSYRRSGGRGSVQVRDRSGAGPSVKRRTLHARARSDAAAHLYAHAAFNGSTDTIDEDVHTFHSTRDVPPPPPDYDDDDVPPPPDGHPPAHSRAVSSGVPNGRRRSSQLRHSQSLGGQMRHHHHNSDDFTNGGGRRKLDPAMSARIRPHAVVRTQTSPGRGPQSPGGTMFSPSSVSTGGGDADDGFQRLIMPPLPPRQIAATGTSVTVQWVCTEATARCFELQFRPRARKEWRSISNRITDRTYVLLVAQAPLYRRVVPVAAPLRAALTRGARALVLCYAVLCCGVSTWPGTCCGTSHQAGASTSVCAVCPTADGAASASPAASSDRSAKRPCSRRSRSSPTSAPIA